MEAIGKKKRLESAKEDGEVVKLIFQYPSSPRAVIKSGKVLETYDDAFCMMERFDGKVLYAYDFLIEIKGVRR